MQSEVKLAEPRTFFGAAVYEDAIIVVGGQVTYDSRTCVQKYYPANPQKGWVNLAAPDAAHRAFGSATLGNYFFLVGGMAKDSGLEPTAKVEAYDMKRDTWFPMADLPGARDCPAAVVMGKELLAVGGFGPSDKDGKPLVDVLHAKVRPAVSSCVMHCSRQPLPPPLSSVGTRPQAASVTNKCRQRASTYHSPPKPSATLPNPPAPSLILHSPPQPTTTRRNPPPPFFSYNLLSYHRPACSATVEASFLPIKWATILVPLNTPHSAMLFTSLQSYALPTET